MRHARGHFTHGDESAGSLRAFGLRLGLFFRLASGRDVCCDDDLRQSPVHPVEIARTHLQPFA